MLSPTLNTEGVRQSTESHLTAHETSQGEEKLTRAEKNLKLEPENANL
jgi:hypothetical protein